MRTIKPVRQPQSVRPRAWNMLVMALAAMSVSFGESYEIKQKQKQDNNNPTLNIIQPRDRNRSAGKPVALQYTESIYTAEDIRMSEARAQKQAFDLYHEVRNTKGNNLKEHDKFSLKPESF